MVGELSGGDSQVMWLVLGSLPQPLTCSYSASLEAYPTHTCPSPQLRA